jgi:hypothetical protein
LDFGPIRRWLSELQKPRKSDTRQRSKALDISEVGSPENAWNNGIGDSGLQFIDGIGLTLPQFCQNYVLLSRLIGKLSEGVGRAQTLAFVHLNDRR